MKKSQPIVPQLDDSEQLALLAILRLGQGNAYGMSVRREIEERGGRTASIAGVYLTLERLEEKGLISSGLGEATPERGGRAKRFYTINGLGEAALKRSLESVRRMAAGLLPTLEAL